MHLNRLAQILFSVGLAGLGLLSLAFGDFALNWQPVPQGIPGRMYFAYASGALLLGGGLAMFLPRRASRATMVLTIFVLSWLVLLQIPRVASDPRSAIQWLGFAETLLLVSGGWVLSISLSRQEGRTALGFIASDGGLRAARMLFAVSLPLIGLSHFAYVDATASMVPRWLPGPRFFAYLTGAGHVAAGLGLMLGIMPRLAATLEAAMITAFVLLLHIPGVVAAPTDRLQWTMAFIATAYAGAAWAVAGSYAGESWRRVPVVASRRVRTASTTG